MSSVRMYTTTGISGNANPIGTQLSTTPQNNQILERVQHGNSQESQGSQRVRTSQSMSDLNDGDDELDTVLVLETAKPMRSLQRQSVLPQHKVSRATVDRTPVHPLLRDQLLTEEHLSDKIMSTSVAVTEMRQQSNREILGAAEETAIATMETREHGAKENETECRTVQGTRRKYFCSICGHLKATEGSLSSTCSVITTIMVRSSHHIRVLLIP